MKKRILSIVIVLTLIISTFTFYAFAATVSSDTVKSNLDSFIKSHPSGSRWTSTFDGGSECYGFAKLVVYNLFGSYSSTRYRSWNYAGVSTSGMNAIGSITNYSASNVKSLLSSAQCGDVLQFDETKQHSMIIYSVGSNSVWIYDCNWDNNCGVSLRECSFGTWSGRNSKKLTLLRSNNYSTFKHTVDTSYGTNFTAYPKAKITAGNILDANHNPISSTAWIGTSDKCTIHEVYTDGCCKLSYPLNNGGTQTAYSKISLFTWHTHSYSGYYYDSAHPHNVYQKCSCGAVQYTGEHTSVKTCKQCWYATFDFSASSISLKVGESKTISATIGGFWPDTWTGDFDYDESKMEVSTGQNIITVKGLMAGTHTLKLNIYSDSTKSYTIGSKAITVTVAEPTYIVSFHANGGTGAPSSQEKYYGKSLTLSQTVPTRSGYTFLGWSTSSTATTASYSAGGPFTTDADTTLYAVWRINDTVNPTGSISSTNNVASSQTVTLALQDNVGVAGYYWGTSSTYSNNTYTNVSGAPTSTTVSKIISNPGTYYLTVVDTSGNTSSRYSITFYKISLNANGGSVSPTSVLVKSGNSITLPTLTRSGYSFVGWNTSSTATTGVKTISPTSSTTYYAIWKGDKTTPSAPAAPIVSSYTATTVTLKSIAGAEYKCGSGAWQTSNVFTGLSPNTSYTFYARLKETTTAYASPSSTGTTQKTATAASADVAVSIVDTTVSKTADTVSVTVRLDKNPGLIQLGVKVEAPDGFTLIKKVYQGNTFLKYYDADEGKTFAADDGSPKVDATKNPFPLTCSNDTSTGNFEGTGVLWVLTYSIDHTKVKAGQSYTFKLVSTGKADAFMDVTMDKHTADLSNGVVRVTDTLRGDADGNGEVENTDRTMLARYLAEWGGEYDKIDMAAADIDGNGFVENTDRTILARYLAEWHGEYDAYFA